jgi:nucleoid-associated protein YgaU
LKARDDQMAAQTNDAANEIAGLRSKNATIQAQADADRAKAAEDMASVQGDRDRLGDQLRMAAQARDDLAKRNADLAQQLEQFKQDGQNQAAEIAQSRADLGRYESNIAELKDKLATDESDLARERSEHGDDDAALTAQVTALRAKMAEMEKSAAKSAADLYAANQQLISNEQALAALRQENARREQAAPPAPPRIHVVKEGDSLVGISQQYYGTENRWRDIYLANREELDAARSLKVGQQLTIP